MTLVDEVKVIIKPSIVPYEYKWDQANQALRAEGFFIVIPKNAQQYFPDEELDCHTLVRKNDAKNYVIIRWQETPEECDSIPAWVRVEPYEVRKP